MMDARRDKKFRNLAVFGLITAVGSVTVASSAHAGTGRFETPPRWSAPQEYFKIVRDSQGRMTRMTLPEGDSVTYDFSTSPHDPVKTRFMDRGRDGKRTSRHEVLMPLDGSSQFLQAFLSPDRIPLDAQVLERLASPIQEDGGYPNYVEDILPAYARPEETFPLSSLAAAALERQLDLLETCNSQMAGYIRGLLRDGRIRHSPNCPEAAVADGRKDGTIYLGDDWVQALEGRSEFVPTMRWLKQRNEDTPGIRHRYFGSRRVSLESLGNPSNDWLFLLGIIHEAGHLVQYDSSRFTNARDVYTYELSSVTRIILGQAMMGAVDRGMRRRQEVLQSRVELWKQSVESGATFFALDQLAACPAQF